MVLRVKRHQNRASTDISIRVNHQIHLMLRKLDSSSHIVHLSDNNSDVTFDYCRAFYFPYSTSFTLVIVFSSFPRSVLKENSLPNFVCLCCI